MATNPSNLRVTGRGMQQIADDLRLLAGLELLVGVPEDKSQREDPDSKDISNAALLYIHENGAPEQNIPSRPSMGPAIAENQDFIAESLAGIARKVVRGDQSAMELGYTRLGVRLVSAIKNKINDGVPPPLAESTLRQRARKGTPGGRKGAQAELERRARGEAPGTDLAKPLVATSEMRESVTYVIRKKERS